MYKTLLTCLLCLCLTAVAYGASIDIVSLPVTGTDAAIDISPDKTYTHTFDFGTNEPVSINGVAFEQTITGNVTGPITGTSMQGFDYTIADTRGAQTIYVHAGGDATNQADGNSAELLRDMMFFGAATVDDGLAVTLSDLTPGIVYSVRFYYRAWTVGDDRSITINADGESQGDFSFDTIEIQLDEGGAYYLDYTFAAEDSDVTIQFITNVDNNGVHLYGLTCEEIGVQESASAPSPGKNETDVFRDTLLSWTPGASATSHDIYLSTDQDSVYHASRSNPMNALISEAQDANTLDPGRLTLGTTYYWRVDEVIGTSVTQGATWSFTVEPEAYLLEASQFIITASSHSQEFTVDKLVDGSGLDTETGLHDVAANTMWLSDSETDTSPWIQLDFGQVSKVHELKIWNYNAATEKFAGFGFKDVKIMTSMDGEIWTQFGGDDNLVQFTQAFGLPNYAGEVLDMQGVSAQYIRLEAQTNWSLYGFEQFGLSEIQCSTIPMVARMPEPSTGATNVDPDTTLSWRPGRGAGSHNISISDDPNAIGATVTSTTSKYELKPLDLSLDTTYYWSVDEVNELLTPTIWSGQQWQFTTLPYYVIDDFEAYTNITPNRPFQTWTDGQGYTTPEPGKPGNGTGASIGHDIWDPTSPFYDKTIMEETIALSGSQSMPVYYSASGSQIDLDLENLDWTGHGLQTLSIAFHGATGNTGELYVMINQTKIVYDLDPADLAKDTWTIWHVDLSTINGLSNVTQLSLGVDGYGASGMFYVDDIRLYAKAPATLTPVTPDDANLVALYSFDGNTQDATGQHHSTLNAGTASYVDGIKGQALKLVGNQDVSVPYSSDFEMSSFTVSAWFNISDTDAVYGILGTRFEGDTTFDVKVEAQRIHADIGNGSAWINTSLDAPTRPTLNTWYHMAYTIDEANQEARIYVNGTLIRTLPVNGTALFMKEGQELHIGNSSAADAEFMIGLLDEVALYNRALSAEEIAGLAGRTMPIYTPF